MRPILLAVLCGLVLACRSPLTRLDPGPNPPSLALAPVVVEDHSHRLDRLRHPAPDEADTPEARRRALDGHGRWLETAFQDEAEACGIRVGPEAPWRLEFRVTNLGEVRTKYIVYGIASGVAWGVGTGLVAHNPQLALGLGGYELLEESAFWIGGSRLFGSLSSPAVVEARLLRGGAPCWEDTYYVLAGRRWLKGLPPAARKDRGVQVRASLQEVVARVLTDVEAIPGFPKGTRRRLQEPPRLAEIQRRILSAP